MKKLILAATILLSLNAIGQNKHQDSVKTKAKDSVKAKASDSVYVLVVDNQVLKAIWDAIDKSAIDHLTVKAIQGYLQEPKNIIRIKTPK